MSRSLSGFGVAVLCLTVASLSAVQGWNTVDVVSAQLAERDAVIAELSTAEPLTVKGETITKTVEVPVEVIKTETVTEYVEVPVEVEVIKEIPVEVVKEVRVEVPTLPIDWEGILADANRQGWLVGLSDFEVQLRDAMSTPCQFEDSSDCFWNAATMGNGEGSSFIDIAGIPYYFAE